MGSRLASAGNDGQAADSVALEALSPGAAAQLRRSRSLGGWTPTSHPTAGPPEAPVSLEEAEPTQARLASLGLQRQIVSLWAELRACDEELAAKASEAKQQ